MDKLYIYSIEWVQTISDIKPDISIEIEETITLTSKEIDEVINTWVSLLDYALRKKQPEFNF